MAAATSVAAPHANSRFGAALGSVPLQPLAPHERGRVGGAHGQHGTQLLLTDAARKMPSARMTKKRMASNPTTLFSARCSGVRGPPPYTWSLRGDTTVGPSF